MKKAIPVFQMVLAQSRWIMSGCYRPLNDNNIILLANNPAPNVRFRCDISFSGNFENLISLRCLYTGRLV